MKIQYRYYDVFPRIVRADKVATVTIRALHDHCTFNPEKVYQIDLVPMEFPFTEDGENAVLQVRLKPKSGALRVKHRFGDEQEFQLLLREIDGDDLKMLGNFRLYSLREDLFVRRPLKGEMHLHSNNSDGAESPGFMASRLRSLGIDYLAVTDHLQYQPSLDLIELFTQVPIDMKIFPGEEVHVDTMEVHVVSFGGKYCVSDLAKDTHKFESEMKKIEEQLAGFRSDYERRIHAGFLWAYRKIKEAGGLSIMAHPHWEWRYHYVMQESILKKQMEDMAFGAYELTSSLSYDSNTLQIARYHQQRAAGKKIPIVGVTDAHSSENRMSFSHTVVFAISSSLGAIIESITDLYSVAVETFPDMPRRAHGPYRLVKYTQFLIREVFPQHDEMCMEEGRQMLAYVAGDRKAKDKLAMMQGQTKEFYDHLWDESYL